MAHHSVLIDVLHLKASSWEGTSSISEAKDSDSTEITSKVRAQNLGNITAVNSLGTMVHGAPCVFAMRSPSQHWN